MKRDVYIEKVIAYIKGNLGKIITYVYTLFVILQCYSLVDLIYPNSLFYILVLFFVSLKILYNLHRKVYQIDPSCVRYCFLYSICMCILLINENYRHWEFLICVFLMFLVSTFLFSNFEERKVFFDAFTNIMSVICVLSLFFFIFGSILHIIQPSAFYTHDQIGWGLNDYYDYYHLYCEGQKASALGYSGVRNIAIFAEGPMLTYNIAIALYSELFFRDTKSRTAYIIIFVATVLTSLSTTGIIVAIVLIYAKIYEKFREKIKFKYSNQVAMVIVVLMCLYVLLDKFSSNVTSSSVRVDDIMACLKCFSHNIINGVGYQNMNAISPYMALRRTDFGISTGLGAILAYGGIIWGIWYIIPFLFSVIEFIRKPNTRKVSGFIVLMSCLLVVTVVQSRVLCIMCNALSWYYIFIESNKTKK